MHQICTKFLGACTALPSVLHAWRGKYAHFLGGALLALCALALRRTPHKREVEMLALPSRAKPSIPVKPFPPARRGERPASPAS